MKHLSSFEYYWTKKKEKKHWFLTVMMMLCTSLLESRLLMFSTLALVACLQAQDTVSAPE